MHQNLGFLFAAFAVTWIAFFGYVLYVQRQLAETQRRLHWLQEDTLSTANDPDSNPDS